MYVKKNFPLKSMLRFSGAHLIWLLLWGTLVAVIYEYTHWNWMALPWLPVSLIGTALAFYVGFKNNSAYDRLWEARKIWGAIVNTSRSWAVISRSYVSNQFTSEDESEEELKKHSARLIKRHIAWLYALRSQMLIPKSWEHSESGKHMSRHIEKSRKKFGVGLFEDEITKSELTKCLGADHERLINKSNTASHILDKQSQDLKELRRLNLIDDFRHMEMQNLITELFTHQGKSERIKNYPLPRQYGSVSFYFTCIFIFLLPFALVPQFHDMPGHLIWMTIPFTALIGWVFVMMELVGDYSENPFEGLPNDIPMLALVRTIEIDLLEMIEEDNIPDPIKPVNSVLM